MYFFPSDFSSSTLVLASSIFQGFMPFVHFIVGFGVVFLLLAFVVNLLK
jgi:hypothetical protein